MNTETESGINLRRRSQDLETLLPSTSASRTDVVEDDFVVAPGRQIGGMIGTEDRCGFIQPVKAFSLKDVRFSSTPTATIYVVADEEKIGVPGDTASSMSSWPEMWKHPEKSRMISSFLPSSNHQEMHWVTLLGYFLSSVSLTAPSERFTELAKTWKKETQSLSNTNEICTHLAYQQIIGMGPLALPFILRDLQHDMAPWFWALKAITGIDPVPEKDKGRIRKMAQHWLDWASIKVMSNALWVMVEMPKLGASKKFKVSSPRTREYNCIAWAAGEDDRWWWPDRSGDKFWPHGVPREEKVEAFIEAYKTLGYEVCTEPKLEAGFEKVASFTKPSRTPAHAARQLPDGKWTSKLGSGCDIVHDDLDGVECPNYGQAKVFLKRPIPFREPGQKI